jgi:DNA-binding beta-propeller fold protein YncE
VAVAIVGSGSVTNVVVNCGPIALLAGGLGGIGSVDGIASTARFQMPYGVVVDSAGNTYVADSYNHTIRKIAAGGVVSTLTGIVGKAGSADGGPGVALFSAPQVSRLTQRETCMLRIASTTTFAKSHRPEL